MLVKDVPLPPQELIFMDRDAPGGFQYGMGLARQLEYYGVDIDSGTVLDIGCGWGRLAYAMLERGFAGRYIGIDIIKNRLDWLSQEMSSRHPNFEFYHFDVANGRYNRDGKERFVDLAGPLNGNKADTVILLSIFTHLYPEEMVSYINDIRLSMGAGGVLVFTCFLWDGVAQAGIEQKKARHTFQHRYSDDTRYDSEDDPLFAIAHTEDFLQRTLEQAGFEAKIIRGAWSGNVKSPQVQDWVIARPVPV